MFKKRRGDYSPHLDTNFLANHNEDFCVQHVDFYRYKRFRKRVIIPVLIKSANMAPMMGTMRKGLTV